MTSETNIFTLLLVAAAFTLGLSIGTVTINVQVNDMEEIDDDTEGQDSDTD